MRLAAIDIGTNSVLLLIAEVNAGGLTALVDRSTITRLGEGVDATGQLAPAAMDRTASCLTAYAEVIAGHGVTRVGAVATSAMRDARGGDAFLDRAEAIVGVRPEVISGRDEALFTFAGALSGLTLAGPVSVFDVGGGSTEIILGEAGTDEGPPRIDEAVSLNVGAVRLTERHLPSDPPLEDELAALAADAGAVLATGPAMAGRPLVGVGGTVTTVAAIVGAVDPYDSARVHGARLSRTELEHTRKRLAALPLAQRHAIQGLPKKRADVIVAGTALVELLAARAEASELVVSDRGVRWGLAQKLALS